MDMETKIQDLSVEISTLQKTISQLQEENATLVADSCFLRQEIRGLKKKLPDKFIIKEDGIDTTISCFDKEEGGYRDYIHISNTFDMPNITDILLEKIYEVYEER